VRVGSARSTHFARAFSLAGALVFVISLAYFLFAYLTRFGRNEGGGAIAAVTWNVTLFTVFALHHSVFARKPVRQWIAQIAPGELERSLYVWIASVLFIAVCAWWRPIDGIAWQANETVSWVLRAAQAAAIWLILRSAVILDVWELAGVRPPAPSPSEFKTTGPYGWVRHPIYSGWFLLVWAATPMTYTRLSFAAVSCAYLLIAMPLEEGSMRTTSRGAYDRYIAQVRWRLVPGLY
jgi:methanethiol S-methyltransferase